MYSQKGARILFMNIKRMVVTSLFCITLLFAVGKKADAAFPYNMEQKPVVATSIKSESVPVYEDAALKNKTGEVKGAKLSIEAYQVVEKSIYGKYKSGKKTGEGWFSLDTFVVNPEYKNVYATVRKKCISIQIENFLRCRQQLKNTVELLSSVKKMGIARSFVIKKIIMKLAG